MIKPGRYRGGISIDKPLLVRGSGKTPLAVVIDGERWVNTVAINGNGVKLYNLTVWNSGSDLVIILAGGTNATLSRVVMRQGKGACVEIAAAGTRILNSRMNNCGGQCVNVSSGDGFLVKGSVVTAAGSDCIFAPDSNARLIGNVLSGCDGYGIHISGGGALVRGNTLRYPETEAMYVAGNDATVQDDVVIGTGEYGIEVQSNHPVDTGNRVKDTADASFYVGCYGCVSGEVSGNHASASRGDGFQLDADGGSGLLVADNVARDIEFDGASLRAPGPYTVLRNDFRGAGGSCFNISTGTAALVVRNKAERCLDSGLEIAGANSTLRLNTAREANMGFHTTPTAAGNTLEDNKSIRDSLQFCDEGTGTTLSGNNFASSLCL